MTFVMWMTDLFIPSLPEDRHGPVLLILDGHASHVSYEVRRLALQHNISLPSHLTHILQPLDIGVFKGMKSTWDNVASSFTRQNKCPIQCNLDYLTSSYPNTSIIRTVAPVNFFGPIIFLAINCLLS